MDDKDRDGFGEFGARLHDPKAERDDFSGQQEMDNGGVVILLEEYEHAGAVYEFTRTFTRAPITPRDVRRRYSNGRVFEVVLRKGYKKRGIWAVLKLSNKPRSTLA